MFHLKEKLACLKPESAHNGGCGEGRNFDTSRKDTKKGRNLSLNAA